MQSLSCKRLKLNGLTHVFYDLEVQWILNENIVSKTGDVKEWYTITKDQNNGMLMKSVFKTMFLTSYPYFGPSHCSNYRR